MALFKKKLKSTNVDFYHFNESGPYFGGKEFSSFFPSFLENWLNHALISLLGIGLLLCSIQVFQFFKPTAIFITQKKSQEQTVQPLSFSIEKIKPFFEYAKILKEREIFNIHGKPIQKTPLRRLPSSSLTREASQLSLVGILREEEPVALIKDQRSQKTFTLKKGEYLRNIKIADIRRGKVLLRMGNQSLELKFK